MRLTTLYGASLLVFGVAGLVFRDQWVLLVLGLWTLGVFLAWQFQDEGQANWQSHHVSELVQDNNEGTAWMCTHCAAKEGELRDFRCPNEHEQE